MIGVAIWKKFGMSMLAESSVLFKGSTLPECHLPVPAGPSIKALRGAPNEAGITRVALPEFLWHNISISDRQPQNYRMLALLPYS